MKITSLLFFLLFTTVISFSQEEIIVKFSKKGGLYFGEKLSVTLSTENTEATIFYSLDGSYPSSGSIKYKEPIKLIIVHFPPANDVIRHRMCLLVGSRSVRVSLNTER